MPGDLKAIVLGGFNLARNLQHTALDNGLFEVGRKGGGLFVKRKSDDEKFRMKIAV